MMERFPVSLQTFLLTVFLLVICLWMDLGQASLGSVLREISTRHGVFVLDAVVVGYLVAVFGLVTLFCSRSASVRWAAHVVFFLCGTLHLSFKSLNGYGFDFNEVTLLFLHPQDPFTWEALLAFAPVFLPIMAGMVVLQAVIWMWGKQKSLHLRNYWLLVPLGSLLFVYGAISASRAHLTWFPQVYKVPAILFYGYLKSLYKGPRAGPEIAVAQPPMFRHVLVIMDESIRGDYLTLNGQKLSTTPFLQTLSDRIVNFGLAGSATNRSSDSNIIVQSGLRQEDIPDYSQYGLKKAGIFQYAKQAGFSTHFIAGQIFIDPREKFDNFMNVHDFSHIDQALSVMKTHPGIPRHEIDHRIPEMIENIVKTQERSFIWVGKMGVHFHYENSYPESARKFMPVLEKPLATIFRPDLFLGKPPDRQAVINSYANAVAWNVDEFFRRLEPIVAGRDVIVLYTSDHGQNLLDDGRTLTHCQTINPTFHQALVPLFLFLNSVETRQALLRQFPEIETGRHAMSHFQVFPTMLRLLGYAPADVERRYGSSLFDRPPARRRFFAGDIFGRSDQYEYPFPEHPEP
jgi:hypothetical protein